MFVLDGQVIYSASDLAAAARCEFALLRTFDAKLGWGDAPHRDEELLGRTATLGEAHEAFHLDQLKQRFGTGVVSIEYPRFTVKDLTAAAMLTRQALAEGQPVVYQAAMFDGRFVGFADFVIREEVLGGRALYRVCDTKLARSAKVTALLQLAAYADTLAAAGVSVAPEVRLILGDRSALNYPVNDIVGVYRQRRIQLQELLDSHLAAGRPVQWSDERIRACFRCAVCEPEVERTDDLLLVAGMRVSQRAALWNSGVRTVAQLATLTTPVADLPARNVQQLQAQAQLQIRQKDTGTPQYEVIDPIALGTLPAPNPGDLFFDFEGDPLWTSDGVHWGLEYLFGVLGFDKSGVADFRPLWAHDSRQERRALRGFLDLVAKRRRRYPGMHVYHYAAYEKTALLRLAGRYGEGEELVDEMLRENILVDLYPVVRKSIRAGAGGYGLKALEPLFLGGKRSGEVTTAVDSINEYAQYCALRDSGQQGEADNVLATISEYNRADCVSTRKLRDWLLVRAFENGITHLSTSGSRLEEEAHESPDAVGQQLTTFAGTEPRTAPQTAAALVAAARGYHQRERKPFWWSHFDRMNNPVDEWADTAGVFIISRHELVQDWHKSGAQRKLRRHLRICGELAGGVLDDQIYALYDPPAPPGLTAGDPDRRGTGNASILEITESGGVPTGMVIQELTPKDGETFEQVPIALTPGAPVMTKALEAAIESVADSVASGLPGMPETAALDILLRRSPRGDQPLPRSGNCAADIAHALRGLDSSYLAVHGPPGTGKTSTAAKVIAALVNNDGWLVGVVAQSHAVVEHLLDQVITAGVAPERVAKKASAYSTKSAWTQIRDSDYAQFITSHADRGAVIGGTAWDFANVSRVPNNALRLLVIDEAGQFSLANTLAVSRAAQNLLLLGDPQQLPQVSQGTHPEPVDTSALGWLVENHGALPPERGYFLDKSYRMHPALCQRVSQLSYGGQLAAAESVTSGRSLAEHTAGVRTMLVHHEGNATSSVEEAVAITQEIVGLLGTAWTDESGVRPLTQSDVLVVAPYNAQVLALRATLSSAGLGEVLVGTVDKFQGRQAPLVFVSMTASAVEDVPRGMSFLLNRNRLNVAISRAQFQAVIVRSPALTEYLPTTPAGLVELGSFLALSPDPPVTTQ